MEVQGYSFSSDAVTEGDPDKIADKISNTVLIPC